MSTLEEFLNTLLDASTDFAKDELKQLINEAKGDSQEFIKQMGDLAEEFIKLRAAKEINNDEFKELMEDLVDLNKMQFHKLSAEAKTRAERIANGLQDLVLDSLLSLI